MLNSSLWNRIFAAILFLAANGCSSKEETPPEDPLSQTQKDAISYFKEIALGFEFGGASEVTRKWESDMIIFIGGEKREELMTELDDVITDLNTLIAREDVEIRITADSASSNFYLFFGTGEEFENRFSPAVGQTDSNYGLFWVYWNGNQELNRGAMYVDLFRPEPLNQRHLLREELTQSLGMAKDSPKYPESIFQSSYSGTATDYSDLDKAVIQMLYHPEVQTGLNSSQVLPILEDIVTEVID